MPADEGDWNKIIEPASDGGHGGNVYLVADASINTLSSLLPRFRRMSVGSRALVRLK